MPNWYRRWLELRNRESLPIRVVACDIDGVLSDCSGRYKELYLGKDLPGWRPDWVRFHGPLMDDEPCHREYVTLLSLFKSSGVEIVLITNRTEDLRDRTEKWLRYNGVPYDQLLMRCTDGFYSFGEQKGVHVDSLLLAGKKVALGIDDDAAERETYESRGIPFLYVHRGFHVGEIANG